MANERRMRKMYPALYTLTLIGKASAIIAGLIGSGAALYLWFDEGFFTGLAVLVPTVLLVFLNWVVVEIIGLLVDLVYHAHNIEIATRQSEANTSWMRTKLKARLELGENESGSRPKASKSQSASRAPSLYSE